MKSILTVFFTILINFCSGQTEAELFLQAEEFLIQNKVNEAISIYEKVLEKNSDCFNCYLNLGRALALKGDYQQAISKLDLGIKLNPQIGEAFGLRGEIKRRLSISPIDDFNQAIELEENNPVHYIRRGNFLSNNKLKKISAMADFEKAIELDQKMVEGFYGKSALLIQDQRWEEALVVLNQAVEIDSTQAILYSQRAGVLMMQNKNKEALSNYNQAIQLDSTNWEFYYSRFNIKYRLEDMDGACDDLFKIKNLNPLFIGEENIKSEINQVFNDICDDSKPSYFYQRGIASYNLEKYDEAISYYSQGLKKFPKSALIRSFRGNAFLAINKNEEAIKDYQFLLKNRNSFREEATKAFRLNQNDNDLDQYFAGSISENFRTMAAALKNIKKDEEALIAFDSALFYIEKGNLKSIPDFVFNQASIFNEIGGIFLNQGKFDQAKLFFEKALNSNSDLSEAYYNLALLNVLNYNAKNEKTSSIWLNYAQSNLSFELNLSKKTNNQDDLGVAIIFLNQAIKKSSNSQFHILRGYVKTLLQMPDACLDFESARQLNDQSVESFINEFCEK